MSDLEEKFLRVHCMYCKDINFFSIEQLNTIQTCPRCKINSYIKNPPDAKQVDLVTKVLGKTN